MHVSQEIEFTKVEQQRVWPPGRECHIACCLGLKTEHPQLLISGGKNFRDIPLKFDLWMLDLTKFVWKKVSHIKPRINVQYMINIIILDQTSGWWQEITKIWSFHDHCRNVPWIGGCRYLWWISRGIHGDMAVTGLSQAD